ncbi:MAG: FAD-dependent oxidoreductase, partial [Acidobacteriota bacterium]
RERAGHVVVRTAGDTWQVRALVACAGLQADRVAAACGVATDLVIAPFRGEYYRLAPHRLSLVRNLIYPVPDPRFPFLGVHFTRMATGGVEAGPNAVMALAREGYTWSDVSAGDLAGALASRGVRRFVLRHLRTGVTEMRRSFSKRLFAATLARLVPALTADDLVPGGSGVRAMALTPEGAMADDFQFVETARMVHVLNAPSPAATACLAIGEEIASRVMTRLA